MGQVEAAQTGINLERRLHAATARFRGGLPPETQILIPHVEQTPPIDYRLQLETYLNTEHRRLFPEGSSHEEAHRKLEAFKRKTAFIMESSDTAARIVSSRDFQHNQTEQKHLKGGASVVITICIDGRIMPVLLGGTVLDIAEAKGGLTPTEISPYGDRELSSPRSREAIKDRPTKSDSQMVEVDTDHADSNKWKASTCAAFDEMVEAGTLPRDLEEARSVFRAMLAAAGEASAATYNRAAREYGKPELAQTSLVATYDTRTAGFVFHGKSGELFTTNITDKIENSPEVLQVLKVCEPGRFKHTFTDVNTLLPREQNMLELEKYLLNQSVAFREAVNPFIRTEYPLFTREQRKAVRFLCARNIALQLTTGLHWGGTTPISDHNEQYASFSEDGLRVGQSEVSIQSFGATVSRGCMIEHARTKIGLFDRIGKTEPTYPIFVSETQQTHTTGPADRKVRASLSATRHGLLRDPELWRAVRSGKAMFVPATLQEKTGLIKSIPNLAI